MIREAVKDWLVDRGFRRCRAFYHDGSSVTVYVDEFVVNVFYPRRGAMISDTYRGWESEYSLSMTIPFGDPDLFTRIEGLIDG